MSKVVFLYSELAPYIIRCMEALAADGVQVSAVAYPVNKEAPFEFEGSTGKVRYLDRDHFSDGTLLQFLREEKPDMIISSGWIDKGYIRALKLCSKGVKKVVALDNQLETGIRAKASAFRAKLFYKSLFDYAWVPGPPQADFARSIGFEEDKIKQKFYTADYERFRKLDLNPERSEFPKRLVYVGRYVDFKGINELFSAFQEVETKEWELFCAGTGDLYSQRPEHPKIHHMGFVQPADLDNFVREGGVFILPSWKEPWGVVIHEFASAGYPIICSENVGAASVFLKHEQNGFRIKAKDKNSLIKAIEKVVSTPDSILFEMGKLSKKLASSYTISDWVITAKEILENE